jgi:hypothetical protein
LLKRIGYRLVLRELRMPQRVPRGGALPLRMEFENIGVAPPYKDYVLAVRLRAGEKSHILDTDAKLTQWVPGKHQLQTQLPLPKELVAGDYEIALGILDPHYREPEVKLAIEGRGQDGWYRFGNIRIA